MARIFLTLTRRIHQHRQVHELPAESKSFFSTITTHEAKWAKVSRAREGRKEEAAKNTCSSSSSSRRRVAETISSHSPCYCLLVDVNADIVTSQTGGGGLFYHRCCWQQADSALLCSALADLNTFVFIQPEMTHTRCRQAGLRILSTAKSLIFPLLLMLLLLVGLAGWCCWLLVVYGILGVIEIWRYAYQQHSEWFSIYCTSLF